MDTLKNNITLLKKIFGMQSFHGKKEAYAITRVRSCRMPFYIIFHFSSPPAHSSLTLP